MVMIGISGTREMPTALQAERIRQLIRGLQPGTTVVTGACVGVDALAAKIAFSTPGIHVMTVVPANRKAVDPNWQRYCHDFYEMPLGTSYRDRNLYIVDLCDWLLAFPMYAEWDGRSTRSGTWQTIRLARKAGKQAQAFVLADIS
jgi:hypothetical protein